MSTGSLRTVGGWALAVLLAFLSIQLYLSSRKLCDENGHLARALAHSEQTTEVKEGLFQRTAASLAEVTSALDVSRADLERLKKLVEEQDAKIVYHSELTLRWKKKYEGLARTVGQIEEPPVQPGDPPRTRVTFSEDLGPVTVSGYTITSPPEAFVSVEQVRPIVLGVSLLQGPDGKWSTVVNSPDDGAEYDVQISLSAVDRRLERDDWRDRLSLDLAAGFVGDPSLSVGARYGGATSIGPRCTASLRDGVGWSCGVDISWRPFDR